VTGSAISICMVFYGLLFYYLASRSSLVSHGTHSEDRLDCRVKVELKVLYIQGLPVQIGKAYVVCFSVICLRDSWLLLDCPHDAKEVTTRDVQLIWRNHATKRVLSLWESLVAIKPPSELSYFFLRVPVCL
jgi:hypothetical protein